MQSFQENRLIQFQVRVVLKPLVSLIGHLVACSARISVDTHTHTHTRRQTDKPTLAAHARRGLMSANPRRTAHARYHYLAFYAFTRSIPLVARGESGTG